jgi:cytochrome c oxidase subunit 2
MLNKFSSFYCDAAENWQIGIQDPSTPIAQGMLGFHNYLMIYLIVIGFFVYWMLYATLKTNSKSPSKFSHSNLLEIIWTVIPAFILVLIAVPSFSLLYSLDEITEPGVTIKVIGHQWYWSYEVVGFLLGSNYFNPNNNNFMFDSYMTNTDDLILGSFRLLEVDNRLVLPTNVHIRLLVTSSDVLHSWAIPSFGIKVDATPGRLSQASLYIKRTGLYYGQCSEICGVNHGFMPIVISAAPYSTFLRWAILSYTK